ncbi:MAG: hypothetical protein V1779_15810 [bacterium]
MFRTLMLIMFFFNNSNLLCEGIEKLLLSPRLTDTITTEIRNYFGLFPGVQKFSSAVLYQDNNSKYFKIKTESSEFSLPVSDSSVLVLTNIIDNFEDILSKKKLIYVNPKLLTNLLSIYTRNNPRLKSIKLTLRDGTDYSGFIVLTDSNFVIMSKDSINRLLLKKLESFYFNDIYSISDIDYSIIDGCKEIFLDNVDSFIDVSYFTNPNGFTVAPPEIWNFLRNQQKKDTLEIRSSLDFDDLYEKKFMLSLDISQQVFNLRGIPTTNLSHYYHSLYYEKNEQNVFSFTDYLSISLDFDYLILEKIRMNIGYNYEYIGFDINTGFYDNSLYGYALNFNVSYNFFNSRLYNFQTQQFFMDLFIGGQIHKFYYSYENNLTNTDNIFDKSILDFDVTKNIKYSYKLGLNIRYKISDFVFWKINGFINYNDDYGLIIQHNQISTRYINYILSYGISGGFGIEF